MKIDFKFTDREELSILKENLLFNKQTIMEYVEDSGLTHILKKIQIDFDAVNNICFYLDCESEIELSRQIVSQIANVSSLSHYVKKNKRHKVFEKILSNIISGLDIIPFVSLGGLANDLFLALNDTIDVDFEHINDYKLEKAVIKLLNDIVPKYPKIFFLFDNFGELKIAENMFVTSILQLQNVYTLFTISNRTLKNGMEIFSKSNGVVNPNLTERTFSRPDKDLTKKLFMCYNASYNNDFESYFVRNNWNIHYIMSVIRGFLLSLSSVNSTQKHILMIIQILETSINRELLLEILKFSDTIIANSSATDINVLLSKDILTENSDGVSINKNISDELFLQIPLSKKLPIISTILKVFELHKTNLTLRQLQFAIANLPRDYTRKKSYIFALIKKLKARNYPINISLIDGLYSFDTIEELLFVCSIYYDEQIYDAPYRKMDNHNKFKKHRKYKILFALICERIHLDNYYAALEKLIDSSRNNEEAVLLLAVLFVAYLNSNKTEEYQKIIFDETSRYFHKKYENTNNYVYLLRNISYYVDDKDLAVRNYERCLNKFKNSDPVNYNRTFANFLNFLMANNSKKTSLLEEKANEVRKILEFNDIKYIYLNISYGLYLMKYTNENPIPYFDCIIFEPGSLITPHLYARTNMAMYLVKTDKREGLKEMYKIQDEFKLDPNVAASAWDFFDINFILAKFINGFYDFKLLNKIKLFPNRPSRPKSEFLFNFYNEKFNTQSTFENKDWGNLFLPGYIFYRGFDAEMLIDVNF